MNWKNINKWSEKEKAEELRRVIQEDNDYWKKVTLLMSMQKMKNRSEFLQMVTRHKLEEQQLFEKEYGISFKKVFKFEDIKIDTKDRDYSEIMKKLVMSNDNYDYNYAKACKQVLKIINHMADGYYEKINENFIKKLHENARRVKQSDIEKVCNFDELNLLDETKDILALIYHKFWKTT